MKEIPLTKGRVAKVDDNVYSLLAQYKWCSQGRGYAIRQISKDGKQTMQYMQHLIVDIPEGYVIEHIDNDPSNNQRYNLRLLTRAEYGHVRKRKIRCEDGYFGIRPHKWRDKPVKWRACIMYVGKYIYSSVFSTREQAARAYDALAKTIYGACAVLNFPEETK